MSDATCSSPDCNTAVPAPGGARGMCSKHYHRFRRHGDASIVHPHGWRGAPEERFWPKVNKAGPTPPRRPDLGPCWLWVAALDRHGYGAFGITDKRVVRAHRFAYEALAAPILAGLELDHLCRNPPCVNPAHLEPVPHRENALRGESPSAQHARKETCPAGHTYDTYDGSRRCSECRNSRQRERYAARQPSGPLVFCECGCGQEIESVDRSGRKRRFVRGHQNSMAAKAGHAQRGPKVIG